MAQLTQWSLPADLANWIGHMASLLHARLAWRFLPLLVGALFGQGRRTVASWLRGGELGGDFKNYYYFLGSLGRKVKSLATVLSSRPATCILIGMVSCFRVGGHPGGRGYGAAWGGAG